MSVAHFILADDQDMSWNKFVPIAIIVAVWIFGALLNQKKQIRRGSPPAPPPQPPRPVPPIRKTPALGRVQQPRPAPRPAPPLAAQQAAALAQMLWDPHPPSGRKGRRVPKPPPARQLAVAPVEAVMPVSPVPVAAVARSVSPRVERGTLVRQLQPAALRTRFILTEILRPPVALRRHDHFADATRRL